MRTGRMYPGSSLRIRASSTTRRRSRRLLTASCASCPTWGRACFMRMRYFQCERREFRSIFAIRTRRRMRVHGLWRAPVISPSILLPEFEGKEQAVISAIHRLAQPDSIELEGDLALIAVVGRGMKSTRGTAGRIFSALAHANINVKMIDQGSSELNIIIGVSNADFENAIRAIYDIFVETQL